MTRDERVLGGLRWVALAAVLAVCAVQEWYAGVTAGLHPVLAAALPLAVDTYVVTSILSGRDVRWAMTTLAATVMVGTVTHAAQAGVDGTGLAVAMWVGALGPFLVYRIDLAVKADLAARAAAAADAEAEVAVRAHAAEVEAARVRGMEEGLAAGRAAERAARRTGRTRTGRTGRAGPAHASTPGPDEVTARRAVHARWQAEHLDAAAVAAELSITQAAARALISRWRRAATAASTG